MRWNLLVEVLQIERGHCARTIGRLPESLVSPEFLIIEMMAQTAGLALGAQHDFETDVVFAKLDQASFEKRPSPTAEFSVEAMIEEWREEGSWFQGKVSSCGKDVAQARLLLLNAGCLNSAAGRSVTFHEDFMRHYHIREKVTARTGQVS